ADEAYTLGVAAELGHLVHCRAHQSAGRADQHDFLAGQHLQRRDGRAVAVRGLHGNHALAAAPVYGRALAVAGRGRGEHGAGAALAIALVLADHDEGYDFLAIPELDAADARRLAPHGANLALVEADCLAAARHQHDLALAVRDRHAHEPVVIVEIDGDDAAWART